MGSDGKVSVDRETLAEALMRVETPLDDPHELAGEIMVSLAPQPDPKTDEYDKAAEEWNRIAPEVATPLNRTHDPRCESYYCEALAAHFRAVAQRQQEALREELEATKDSLMSANECLDMVAERLAAIGCKHGAGTRRSTPPMMYPEWISCVVQHATNEARAENEKLNAELDKVTRAYDGQYARSTELSAEVVRLRTALGYYADPRTWDEEDTVANAEVCHITDDQGGLARAALEQGPEGAPTREDGEPVGKPMRLTPDPVPVLELDGIPREFCADQHPVVHFRFSEHGDECPLCAAAREKVLDTEAVKCAADNAVMHKRDANKLRGALVRIPEAVMGFGRPPATDHDHDLVSRILVQVNAVIRAEYESQLAGARVSNPCATEGEAGGNPLPEPPAASFAESIPGLLAEGRELAAGVRKQLEGMHRPSPESMRIPLRSSATFPDAKPGDAFSDSAESVAEGVVERVNVQMPTSRKVCLAARIAFKAAITRALTEYGKAKEERGQALVEKELGYYPSRIGDDWYRNVASHIREQDERIAELEDEVANMGRENGRTIDAQDKANEENAKLRAAPPLDVLDKVRPEIAAFARIMESKLRKHDHDRGQSWKTTDVYRLLEALEEETTELERTLEDGHRVPLDVRSEAADVANFAMMIADVCGGLAENGGDRD